MATKYGVFSEPTYLSPGDRYDNRGKTKKITEIPPANVKTGPGRLGKANDATFDRFKPLFEKEPYRDRLKSSSSQPLEQTWKSPSPMKQSSGLGDYYGTIGGKIAYIPVRQGSSGRSQKLPDVSRRSIYTSPGKKGSHRTTLSQLRHSHGVVSEYAYQSYPYLSEHDISAAENKCERSKRYTEHPFKPSGTSRHKSHEWTYLPQGPLLNKNGPKGRESETPFRPAGRAGLTPTIGRFPEFLPNGQVIDLRKVRSESGPTNPWKPSSSFKTDCTRSIIRMNVF